MGPVCCLARFAIFLGFVRGTLEHSTQVSEHKLNLDLLKRVSDQEIVNLKKISEGEGAAKGKLMS